MTTLKQIEKAERSFDYACKQASKCRKEERVWSCYACDKMENCEIQKRVNKNLAIMRENR